MHLHTIHLTTTTELVLTTSRNTIFAAHAVTHRVISLRYVANITADNFGGYTTDVHDMRTVSASKLHSTTKHSHAQMHVSSERQFVAVADVPQTANIAQVVRSWGSHLDRNRLALCNPIEDSR